MLTNELQTQCLGVEVLEVGTCITSEATSEATLEAVGTGTLDLGNAGTRNWFLQLPNPSLVLTLVGSSAPIFGPMVLQRFAAAVEAAAACLLFPTVAMPAILTGTRLTPV